MERELIIWLTIGAYILFMLIIGLLNARSAKGMTEFTVGGRNAGGWMSALSYGTAYFSAVMFIGYAGKSGWSYGMWSILVGVGNAVFGSLLAWIVLAKRTRETTRRLKIKSMPQLFAKRFNSEAMKMFAVAIIFVFMLPYSASVYKGLTSVCSVLLKVDETLCMIVIAAVSALIVVLGGYMAQLKADFVQGIIMLVGVVALIIAIVRCDTVGGLTAGLTALAAETENLNLSISDHIGLWATVLMTSFGTWGLPQMVHKYYGIRDNHEVRRGTIVSTVFALVVAGGGYFIGSFAHLFFTKLPSPPSGGAGHPDYLIPNMLSQAGLPTILLGVVLVLLVAASVSTLSSITITSSSTFTMDFLTTKVWKNMSSQKAALLTKCICVLFIALSYIIANTNTPILDMMSYSWGVISGSFLAPYMVSLYWKKLNRAGGWASMLGGFFTALPPLVCMLFFPNATLPLFGKVANLGPHFACLAILVSFTLCFVVSKIAAAAGLKSAEENTSFYAEEEPEKVLQNAI